MDLEEIKNSVVLLRVDFNVPVENGKISDHSRILASLPTINLLIENSCKIVLISHLGRPKPGDVETFSFKKILPQIENILEKKIEFTTLQNAEKTIKDLPSGGLLMLENIRFHKQEEENDSEFARELASLGEFYVNDAFSVSHRSHVSVVGLADCMPSALGLSCKNEIKALSGILHGRSIAIVGGSKISTKLPLILGLLSKVDKIIVGGAIASTILKKQGFEIGKSLHEEFDFELDLEKIFAPFDFITSSGLDDKDFHIIDARDVPEGEMILDIGPASVIAIKNLLTQYETVLWNGPVGAFEYPPFDAATKQIGKFISTLTKSNRIKSIVGGGDTLSAVAQLDEPCFSHLSTAGGAFLKFLQDGRLVGIEAVKKQTS